MAGASDSLIGNAAFAAPGQGALDQRLSLDVQGVDALRRTVRNSPQEGMRQASKQFEVMFMQMMLKSMREATPSEGLLGSQQEKTYTAMLDQQLAQSLSGRGLGLAEAMFAQLNRSVGTTSTEGAAGAPMASPFASSQGLPSPSIVAALSPAARAAAAWRQTPPTQAPELPVQGVQPAGLSAYEGITARASLSRSHLPAAQVEQFVARLMPAAQRAAQASGVPAQLIMAQAALESGWGKREITGPGGEPSHNLFGIKADKSWKGPVVEVATTEFVNGAPEKTRAAFRAYGSYDEAFADYARFLVSNPRYTAVRHAPDAAEAAHGLQRAGYATDPNYGAKLVQIMKKIS